MHDNLIFLLCTAISYYIYCGGALKIGYTVLTPRSVNRLSSTIVFPINFSVLCLVRRTGTRADCQLDFIPDYPIH